MSEALELFNCYKHEILSWTQISEEDLDIIEKELKQAQEDKKVLNIFKNALAIKHTYVLPKEQDQDDTFSYACRYLFEITQNDIDEKLRKSLREWVLKNAFPKELKAFKVVVKTLDIRVSMNEMGQCFLEDNHCIYAIPRSTYDLITEALNGLL